MDSAYHGSLIFTVVVLQLLDLGTTAYGIKLGAREVNPLLARIGPKGIIAAKIAFIVTLLWFQAQIASIALGVIIALYVFVVSRNLKVIWKIKSTQKS